MDNIIVRLVDMPCSVDGTTVRDDDGNYNIYINARTSRQMQFVTLRHELSHIGNNHFDDGRPLLDDEMEAEESESNDVDSRVLANVYWGGMCDARKGQ